MLQIVFIISRQKSIVGTKLRQAIKKVQTVRNFVITLVSKLIFDQHIDQAMSKASKALGFIMRTAAGFHNLNPI